MKASLALGLLATLQTLDAATSSWSGTAGATWNNAGNWDALPAASGDSLVFAGTSNLSNSNDYVTGVAGITFDSGAGAFTLGGNVLTVASGGSITNNSTSGQTLAMPLTNSGATTLNAASGNLTLTGLLGGGSLVIDGAGGNTVTLTRAGSNTFGMGATVNSGGTLVLFNTSGNALSNFVTINDGGTVKLGGTSTDQIHFNSVLTLSGASALFDLNGKTEEVGKLLGTAGSVRNNNATTATLTIGGGTNNSDFSNILLANGTGTLAVTTRAVANTYTFGAANTYTGKTTLGGISNVSVLANGGVASSIGQSSNASANLAIGNSGVLRYTGASASTDRNFTTGTGSAIEIVNAATNLVLTGTSFGAFTKTGPGTLTLSGNVASAAAPSVSAGVLVLNAPGANAFSGAITVANGGTMRLGSSSTGNMIHDNTTLAVNTGGTFDMGGQSEKFKSISGAGTFINSGLNQSTLTVSGFSGSSTFDGVISGDIALTHTDASSSTTLNGLNTYSGNTQINSATATFTLGSTGGLTFYIGDNGINNQVTGVLGATANFNGRFTFDLSSAETIDGYSWTIVDAGSLVTSYGGTFAVDGFTNNAGVWSKTDGGATWTFAQTSGILSASTIPEPASFAAVIGLAALGASGLRRRRR